MERARPAEYHGAARAGSAADSAMALASGTRLGPHEIVAPLGAGGRGEVYKARDTRLDRSVAIWVLPEQQELT